MRIVDPARDRELDSFAGRAAEAFKGNHKLQVYTDEAEIEADQLVGLRWNPFTVLVLETADCNEVLLFEKDTVSSEELELGTIDSLERQLALTREIIAKWEIFTPTPEYINRLPGGLRQYIHDLENEAAACQGSRDS